MSKNVTDLRAILFDAIEAVKTGAIDLDKARTINDLSRTIVDSARAENDYAKITGGNGGEFLADNSANMLPGKSVKERTANGVRRVTDIGNGASVTVHKML